MSVDRESVLPELVILEGLKTQATNFEAFVFAAWLISRMDFEFLHDEIIQALDERFTGLDTDENRAKGIQGMYIAAYGRLEDEKHRLQQHKALRADITGRLLANIMTVPPSSLPIREAAYSGSEDLALEHRGPRVRPGD